MNEKTLQGMRKDELINVLKETISEINTIREKNNKILEKYRVFEEGDFTAGAEQAHSEIVETLDEIKEFRKEIFGGDDESDSIKSEIDSLLDDCREHKARFEELKKEMCGHTTQNDEGDEVKHKGYMEKIKETLQECEENHKIMLQKNEQQYAKLYNKIEVELLSGATSVSLSKDFNKKIQEYRRARRFWQGGLLFTLIGAIYYFFDIYDPPLEWDSKELLLSFLRHIPSFSFFAWLVIFMGNRRAENLKLEESYKHKEAMAISFTGYKRSIEELSGEDKSLLTSLMGNLLDAIKKDSSRFLSSKGEGHPATDLAKHCQPK